MTSVRRFSVDVHCRAGRRGQGNAGGACPVKYLSPRQRDLRLDVCCAPCKRCAATAQRFPAGQRTDTAVTCLSALQRGQNRHYATSAVLMVTQDLANNVCACSRFCEASPKHGAGSEELFKQCTCECKPLLSHYMPILGCSSSAAYITVRLSLLQAASSLPNHAEE